MKNSFDFLSESLGAPLNKKSEGRNKRDRKNDPENSDLDSEDLSSTEIRDLDFLIERYKKIISQTDEVLDRLIDAIKEGPVPSIFGLYLSIASGLSETLSKLAKLEEMEASLNIRRTAVKAKERKSIHDSPSTLNFQQNNYSMTSKDLLNWTTKNAPENLKLDSSISGDNDANKSSDSAYTEEMPRFDLN